MSTFEFNPDMVVSAGSTIHQRKGRIALMLRAARYEDAVRGRQYNGVLLDIADDFRVARDILQGIVRRALGRDEQPLTDYTNPDIIWDETREEDN